jgi:ATP/ADP translocase
MTNVISFILPALLTAVFLFTTDNAYSQPDDSNAYVNGITSERAKSLVGVAIGLASVIVAWRVKTRSAVGTRNWVIIALVMGLVALILSVIHLGNVNGGFGTGGGKAGAIVALVLGLIGTSLSGMALRTRRK